MTGATYVCGPDDRLWDEPFMIGADAGTDKRCEIGHHDGHVACKRRVKWMVETVGWNGRKDPPMQHPIDYVCTLHLAAVLTARLKLAGRTP